MDQILLIFQIIVFIFSVMVHEISHGAVALKLGDDTAKKEGRLTLNPLKHIDPIGSVILPLFLIVSRSPFIIGWAKPVPIDPRNLKNPRTDAGLIGAAGPLSNFFLAIVFGVFIRILTISGSANVNALIDLLSVIVFTNLILGIFNLVPLPPLDGSSVLFAILPQAWSGIRLFLLRYGFWILLFFVFFGFQFLAPIIISLFRLITGITS